MKDTRSVALFFIVFVLLFGGILFTLFQSTNRNPLVLFRLTRPEEPIRMLIPSLHINTIVEAVGKDEQGRMDVPKKTDDVAWYEPGFRPGENGNAVIAGHFDTPFGTSAVFYHLKDLKPGAKITIIDKNNKTREFIVRRNISYDDADIPLQEIFALSNQSHLNLITCDGYYDSTARNYTKRDVVYADEEGGGLNNLFSYRF